MRKTIEIPDEIMLAGGDVLDRYKRMIRNGESPRFAEMCALRSAPRLDTDTSYIAKMNRERGGMTLAEQFRGNEPVLQHRIEQAKKEGFSPSASDFYEPLLARYPGDSRAWIGAAQGISEIRRRMAEAGEGVERAPQGEVSR